MRFHGFRDVVNCRKPHPQNYSLREPGGARSTDNGAKKENKKKNKDGTGLTLQDDIISTNATSILDIRKHAKNALHRRVIVA